MQILRLTFDRDRLSFDANNMGETHTRRVVFFLSITQTRT